MNRMLCVVLLPLLWSVAACAVPSALSLRLASPEYPPYLGERLPDGGILAAMVSEVFRRGNVTVSYVWLPNNRALESARNGVLPGSLGWTPTPERKRDLLFSDEVLSFRMVMFQRAGRVLPWSRPADLSRYRLGLTVGNFYSPEFESLRVAGAFQLEMAGSDSSNLRKLVRDRIDLFPMEEEAGLFLAAAELAPEEARQVVPSGKPYWRAPLCLVISRRYPQAAVLMARFNSELKRMRASGELERLASRTRQRILLQQQWRRIG